MKIIAATPQEYLAALPEDRRQVIEKLRMVLLEKLPHGFEETIVYDMIGYVVPLSKYPQGYHCAPNTPLPFISLASQKNFVALYHSGIYADETLKNWFEVEYPKHSVRKLDMGKSCIRFKNPDHIPYALIGELAQKMSPEKWIEVYEETYLKKN